MPPDNKSQILEYRFKQLSNITRLGHEAFSKNNIPELWLHILNNSTIFMPYNRCCLVDLRSGSPEIVGISGQSTPNKKSEYSQKVIELLKPFSQIRDPLFVEAGHDVPEATLKYFKDSSLMLVPIHSIQEPEKTDFVWLVELSPELKSENTLNLFFLLGKRYGEAICYLSASKDIGNSWFKTLKYKLSGKSRIIYLSALVILVLALIFWKIPSKASCDFVIIPEQKNIVYAPFAGTVDEVFFEAGDQLSKDSVVLNYNTEELNFDLAVARKKLEQILAEIDLTKANSFSDNEYLGNIKILELKKDQEKARINKILWYLQKSKLKSPATGNIVINDRQDLLGKNIQAGEKLFEILSNQKLQAEIYLNEKEAGVLTSKDQLKAMLYPNSTPEKTLYAKIISISPVPLPRKNNQYAYRIKAELPDENQSLHSGMRGTAIIYGKKVSLGYYLFKNLILWWRKI
jgi:multidrug resistance efflux pump